MKIERFLSQTDAAILCRLAEHLLRLRDVKVNPAERLIDMIKTAILLPENVQRSDCVSLYSNVTYRTVGTKDCDSIFIVCPQDANDDLARVSILTPLALALIGRPKGSIVQVTLPLHRIQFIVIVDVQSRPLVGSESGERVQDSVAKNIAQRWKFAGSAIDH